MNQGFTLWLTGKPGTGKNAVSRLIQENLLTRGLQAELLDDSSLRTEVFPELGESRQDFNISARLFGHISQMLNRNDIVCIVAAVSPDRSVREKIKGSMENFIEIHLDSSAKYDIKIEKSAEADLELNMDSMDPYGASSRILAKLEEFTFIAPKSEDYTEEEKAEIDARLKSLGYM